MKSALFFGEKAMFRKFVKMGVVVISIICCALLIHHASTCADSRSAETVFQDHGPGFRLSFDFFPREVRVTVFETNPEKFIRAFEDALAMTEKETGKNVIHITNAGIYGGTAIFTLEE